MSHPFDNKPIEQIDTEIKVRSLLFYILKKWRLVLTLTLIMLVCTLGFSAVKLLMEVSDDEYIDVVAKEYNEQVIDYTSRIQTLEREIEQLEDDLVWQHAYNQDSSLMKIDPYSKMVSTMTYYVDADEQIDPDYLEQYISVTDTLLKRYMLYLNSGELYAQLLEQFPEMIDVRYIKELVSVTMYDTTGMIILTVIGNDDETAQTIFSIALNGMMEIYNETVTSIGEHKLIVLDSSSYSYQDLSLATRQQTNLEMIYTLDTQIREKYTELDSLNKEYKALSLSPLWRRTVVQFVQTALYTVLGTIMVLVFFLAMYYVSSDRILDLDKLRNSARLNTVGVIPCAARKRKWLLDQAAAAIGGITLRSAERDAVLALTAQSICQTVLAKGISRGTIALTGSIAAEELKTIAAAFNQTIAESELHFAAAGNAMRDVSSVEAITAADAVVIVEKQNQSRCADVLQETARIAAWDQSILGIVLLDADAR